MCPLISFSQGLSRQLYKHYFERMFEYEPSLIRENNILKIIKHKTLLIGDSIVYNQVEDSTTFREDGRPVNRIYWYNNHRESILCNYTYDSLGNLTEVREWQSETGSTSQQERLYIRFNYNSKQLKTIFRYRGNYRENYLMMESCDSLNYLKNKPQVEIYTGCISQNIIFSADIPPVFVPYENNKQILDYTITGNSEKPIDKKAVWENENRCNYDYIPALAELKKITGRNCFPSTMLNAIHPQMVKTMENDSIIEFGFMKLSDSIEPLGDILHIDKKNQTIKLQTIEVQHIPTSMEDYITQYRTIFHYDFSLKLVCKEVFRKDMGRNDLHRAIIHINLGEHERAEYERSIEEMRREYKDYVTTYEYNENGLLKQETTHHRLRPWLTDTAPDSKLETMYYQLIYRE